LLHMLVLRQLLQHGLRWLNLLHALLMWRLLQLWLLMQWLQVMQMPRLLSLLHLL